MNLKGKQTKRGFTLIELLAVIVILAIIALITVPIVLNMVEDAKKASVKDSAYGYINAIETYTALSNIDNKKYPTIIDGTYENENKFNNIKINGQRPTSIKITLEKGIVKEAELCIDNYKINYNGQEVTDVDKGCSNSSTPSTPVVHKPSVTSVTGATHKGIVYLNPTDLTVECTESNSQIGTGEANASGCMKFYIFDDSGSNYKMILDHNTTALVAWNSNGSNASMGEVATALSTDATGWTTGLNPRLITADEVAHIVGADSNDTIKWSSSKGFGKDEIETKSSWIYLDGGRNSDPTVYASGSNGWQKKYANSTTPSNYAWLFDYTNGCESYGCTIADSSTYGYWTSSPVSDTSRDAWYVNFNGILSRNNVDIGRNSGVRPVITLSKSEFSS